MCRSEVSVPHMQRTAQEPRAIRSYKVLLDHVEQVNEEIKLFQLVQIESETEIIKFLPGQWLDVHVPSVPKAGGFTITSAPSALCLQPPSLSTAANLDQQKPHIQLAIQRSPLNPVAAWFWQPAPSILGVELQVRVGGSFTWPPPLYPNVMVPNSTASQEVFKPSKQELKRTPKRVIFIAGGVGINPLMSMITQIALDVQKICHRLEFDVKFFYTVRDPGVKKSNQILFLEALRKAIARLGGQGEMKLFLTESKQENRDSASLSVGSTNIPVERRRIQKKDLLEALGPVEEREDVVCYVCGVPGMTDEFVEILKEAKRTDERNILFEKWW